jgi:hypothetical protein
MSKTVLVRKIAGCWGCQAAYNCWITCCLIGCLQRPFYANFRTFWQACCNRENMLKENAILFYVCIFI